MSVNTRQTVRYVTASDGVRLAWAESGAGPPLVKAATWLTHLDRDLDSPVWRHWIEFLSGHFRFIRYDERGCGMSDWDTRDLSLERWVRDLEAVVEAADIREPFVLLGMSHGAAVSIAYAARHPDRVASLVLYGGYARGVFRRGAEASQRVYAAISDASSRPSTSGATSSRRAWMTSVEFRTRFNSATTSVVPRARSSVPANFGDTVSRQRSLNQRSCSSVPSGMKRDVNTCRNDGSSRPHSVAKSEIAAYTRCDASAPRQSAPRA